MRGSFLWLSLTLAGLMLVFGACSPRWAPSPPSTISSSVPPPSPAAPRTSRPNAEEVAWAKVLAEANKEGKVTAYSFGLVGDVGSAVSKAFSQKYGITLEIITGRGAEFTERLRTERRMGQVVGDMLEGSGLLITNMKEFGLLAPVSNELPVLREKDVWWVHPTSLDPKDKAVLGNRQLVYGPWVNTTFVKPGEEPSSWRDLLKPKWKGKMGLMDPRLNGGPALFTAVFSGTGIWDEEYVRALGRQDIRLPVSTMEASRMLSKGETELDIIGTDTDNSAMASKGAPIRAVSMSEGNVIVLSAVAAIDKAPHPAAAKVFLNWLLSKEGHEVYTKAMVVRGMRKDVPDFRPAAAQVRLDNPIVATPEMIEKGNERFRARWFDKVMGK